MVLVDASNLGEKIKEGKNQKTVLNTNDEAQIIDTFNNKETADDFSVVVSYEEIQSKNYSLSAGQYFEVKIEYVDINPADFEKKIDNFNVSLSSLFQQSRVIEKDITRQLSHLKYE